MREEPRKEGENKQEEGGKTESMRCIREGNEKEAGSWEGGSETGGIEASDGWEGGGQEVGVIHNGSDSE
eukprot:3384074-Pleurochrysis_carterae.AAC.1